MLDFIKALLPADVMKAWIQARVRQAFDWAAAPLGAWLIAHHASQTDVTNMEQGGLMVALALASWVFDLWDGKKVDSKIATAAVTGSVVAGNDSTLRSAVTTAVASGQVTAPHGYALFPHPGKIG